MKSLCLFLFFVSISNIHAATKSFYYNGIPANDKCQLRAFEARPENKKIIADYFFFIGYGDRADNHLPLFNELNQKGIRVLSFDYPSHGLTKCGELNHNNYSSLMSYAELLEKNTREDVLRPVILSGWSTGGLLALRLAQTNKFNERSIKSLVLIAPGISVYVFVGGDGIIRDTTLTSNPTPPHLAPPTPISPLLTPLFSATLVTNGILARKEGLPNIPTLMFIAGHKKDMYAKTPVLLDFAKDEMRNGANLKAIQCKKSMHEMDNEIESIGSYVRQTISHFVVNPSISPSPSSECSELKQ